MKMQRIKDKLFQTLDKAEMAKVVAGDWTYQEMPTLIAPGQTVKDDSPRNDSPSPPGPIA